VIDGVAAGATPIRQLGDRIYPKLQPALRVAATLTLRAHVEYLADQGAIRMRRGVFGTRLAVV
jgi:hypothetical protein